MNNTYHLGRRLMALAISGGAGVALFGGAAAYTQFSATLGQTAVFAGGSVAEQIGNGSFHCSGLVPPNNAPELQNDPTVTGGTYADQNCIETVTFENTGSVPESSDVTNGNVTSPELSGTNLTTALGQLQFTVGSGSTSTTVGLPSSGSFPNPFHLATIPPHTSLPVTFTISLKADSTDPVSVQNLWNGATVSLPYTVTATPSAS